MLSAGPSIPRSSLDTGRIPVGKRKIFALPNAGGTAKLFRKLKNTLAEQGVELLDLDYARHGARSSEPAYSTFAEMAEDMASVIQKNKSEEDEIILFGYSMGALVTYDILTRCFSEQERKQVSHLFLAAHEPPHIEFCGAKFADCDEKTFISGMQEMGGLDDRLIGNPRFLKIFVEQIRSDYRLINGYVWNGEKGTITVPVTILYSEEDTPLSRIGQWRDYVSDPDTFSVEAFEGGHFFIRDATDRIAELLVSKAQVAF